MRQDGERLAKDPPVSLMTDWESRNHASPLIVSHTNHYCTLKIYSKDVYF